MLIPSGVCAGDRAQTAGSEANPALQPAAPVAAPAAVAGKADPVRQREIFQILQGGALLEDASLADHLWRVAGSLALRDWSPPRVQIHVVVGDADSRR
jgi:hypothetical protein